MAIIKASSKVTLARICGKPKRVKEPILHPDPEKAKNGEKYFPVIEGPLALIEGRVDGWTQGQTDLGPYIEFHGVFDGTDLTTGEVISAPKAILPSVAQDMTISALTEAQRDDKTAAVQVAFVIGALDRPLSSVGYEYDVRVITTDKVEKPLANLRASIQDDLANLLGAAGVKTLGLPAPVPQPDADAGKGGKKKEGTPAE